VSCAVQALSGFVVDKFGPRPILFGGLSLLGLAAFGYSISTSYWMLAGFAVIAGIGNGVFHPVDYTLLNRKVSAPRLGHAYSVHGITGSLGWALAPAMLVPLTFAFSWRVALACAGVLAFAVLAVLVLNRDKLTLTVTAPAKGAPAADSSLGFLKIPPCGCVLPFSSGTPSCSAWCRLSRLKPRATCMTCRLPLVAMCLTIYMVCSAGGMVLGGFLASDPARCERIVGIGFGVAALARYCWPWAATRRGWCRCCSA
jgi:FSR family fosmidomycin resistance protein-like MFS transporter